MSAGCQEASVLAAVSELEVFVALGDGEATAEALAQRLDADNRGLTILLDAAVALGLLEKGDDRYRVPPSLRNLLSSGGPDSVLPMLYHRANIARGWSMLACTVKAGFPDPRAPSVRGAEADREAFVAAMHTASGPSADDLVASIGPPAFDHLLDVGGASGTWTQAFLKARPGSRATIFDLPHAIDQARTRLAGTDLAGRVAFAPGDFYRDELPSGADLAWVSAIVHQHSRRHNRELLARVFRALQPGGVVALREIVMSSDRTSPLAGAMFAVNMLANTETGNTFTFSELAEDLQSAGFRDVELIHEDPGMNSVVAAHKPP